MSGRAWVLLIPVAVLVAILGSAVAWVVAVGAESGAARGGRMTMVLSQGCGNEAILARLADYGLDGTAEGNVLTFRLPGMADDAEHMPRALTREGHLVLTVGGTAIPATVRHTGVQLSMMGNPVTLLTLDVALPGTGLVVTLDGEVLELDGVNGGEIQIRATDTTPERALRKATDRVVAIRHPLPCRVQVLRAEASPPG
jgi:hypothetical protein